MDSGKDIHKDFTPELQKRGEGFGFDYEQVEMGINDYEFSPHDADFAVFIGDNDLIISEMTKENLEELREEYNEAVKNKEINFAFKRENEKEEEEEETIASNEEDGRNIHHDFTPDLIQRWQECGFSYEKTNDGINIGMGITDVEFCAGLRNVRRVNAEGVLNNGNVEQLRNEYQSYCLLEAQQIQVSHW